MDFDLSDDQLALRGAARDLLDGAASNDRVRAFVDAASSEGADQPGYDRDLWKQLAAQGWLAIEVPEDAGGLGFGTVEVSVLAEQVGRHVAPAPWLSTTLALHAVRRAGDGGWVERLASGDAIGAVGYGDAPVVDAPVADVVILVRGNEVQLVDQPEPPAREPGMDLTRTLAWVDAEGERIGGAELADELLDRGAAAYSAELLGSAERMLEEAVAYAKVREQFGRPIGSFQAVKHRLADALVDIEGMRSAAYYAAWAVQADAPDRSLAASSAKSWCSDAATRVIDSALQVHGGIGFTWEHDLHLYLKRAHLDATLFGTAAAHRERLAGLLRDRLDAGADLW